MLYRKDPKLLREDLAKFLLCSHKRRSIPWSTGPSRFLKRDKPSNFRLRIQWNANSTHQFL